MRRHPQLSLRQPQTTTLAKAQGFNVERVNAFLDLLERIVEGKTVMLRESVTLMKVT